VVLISCSLVKKTDLMKYKLDFHTAYNQFYLTSDNGDKSLQDASWSEESFNDRLDIKENLLTIYTGSYGHIRGELTVLQKPNNDFVYSEYSHIVEGGIAVDSGELKFLDCPTSTVAMSLRVKPGSYKVRIYMSNLIDTDEDESTDYYKIEIWPDSATRKVVLKEHFRIKSRKL